MPRLTIPTPDLVRSIPNGQYNAVTRESRLGVMLHFDASGTDEGAWRWFEDPRCKVSYNWLVLDDGRYVEIAPRHARAWHAGVCRSSDPVRLPYSDANSAFYGLSLATNTREGSTEAARLTLAWLARRCFEWEGWAPSETWRIVGHDAEAWPRGRKIDPVGVDAKRAILAVDDIRHLVPLLSL